MASCTSLHQHRIRSPTRGPGLSGPTPCFQAVVGQIPCIMRRWRPGSGNGQHAQSLEEGFSGNIVHVSTEYCATGRERQCTSGCPAKWYSVSGCTTRPRAPGLGLLRLVLPSVAPSVLARGRLRNRCNGSVRCVSFAVLCAYDVFGDPPSHKTPR